MQMGARWMVGAQPHSSVPAELHGEIAHQESLHPGADSWTLTWLEGRPRAALDDLVVVSVSAEGQIVVSTGGTGTVAYGQDTPADDDDDEWLT